MNPTRHRVSLPWLAVFLLCAALFGALGGYGLSCAGQADEVCQSVWGRAAGTVAVYGWIFLALALLAIAALALLATSELLLSDEGLTLRIGPVQHAYRTEDLIDFQFVYTSRIRMYRVRTAATDRTLLLPSFFARFDQVERWLQQHVRERR